MLKTLKNSAQFIRSLVFYLGLGLSAIFFFVTGCFLFPFSFSVRYRYLTLWSAFVVWWAKIICGISHRVIGLENLPSKNAIIFSKHQSAWETLFLQTLLPAQTWVLKKELLLIPFFGWGLRLLEPIAVDRSKSSSLRQVIDQATQRLKQGRWIILFPEGSRIAVGKKGKYSRSGALLAKESGYGLVPVAHNAGVYWPKNSFIKKSGTIEVVIGPFIDPHALTVDEIHQKAVDWIENQTSKLDT